MNPILSTMEHRGDTAVRLDVRGLAEARPWLVDEWLLTSACGHPECQVVLALGRIPTGDDGVLGKYSHMIFHAEHAGRGVLTPQALFDDALGAAGVEVVTLIEHPIPVPDDERARDICHHLARSLLAGALPWRPRSREERATWQMTIVMALLDNHKPTARIDPRKSEAGEPLGGGFPINSARPGRWVGQDQEEARDREHG